MLTIDTAFVALLALIVVQRIVELVIAKRNTERLIAQGGMEFGSSHYPVMVALHTGFFISLAVEYLLAPPDSLMLSFLALLVLGQIGRVWLIGSMHGRWTTRVIVVPGEKLIGKGPFRFLKHPNYLIVAIELLALPMVFTLTATAVIFTLLNALVLLYVRIPVENAALEWSQQSKV